MLASNTLVVLSKTRLSEGEKKPHDCGERPLQKKQGEIYSAALAASVSMTAILGSRLGGRWWRARR